jgi:hypothetical protein
MNAPVVIFACVCAIAVRNRYKARIQRKPTAEGVLLNFNNNSTIEKVPVWDWWFFLGEF